MLNNPLAITCTWIIAAFWCILRMDILFLINQSKPRTSYCPKPVSHSSSTTQLSVSGPLDLKLEYIINTFFSRIRLFILDRFCSHFSLAFTFWWLFLKNKISVSFGLTSQTWEACLEFTCDILANPGEVLKVGVI